MKKFIYSLIAGGLSLLSVSAATLNLTTTGAATNSLLQDGAVIYSISVNGVVGTSINFGLIDAPTNVVTFTSPGFTNTIYSMGYITNAYTNVFGYIETNNYYRALLSNTLSVTAFTNSYPQITRVTGVTNQTVLESPQNPYFAFRGILVTNNGAGVISINYAPIK